MRALGVLKKKAQLHTLIFVNYPVLINHKGQYLQLIICVNTSQKTHLCSEQEFICVAIQNTVVKLYEDRPMVLLPFCNVEPRLENY